MKFYDDGGIDFAQKQFDKAREFNKQQAEDQEKFSKLLQKINAVVGFVDFGLNKKADDIANQNVLKNAAYFTAQEGSNQFNKNYNNYKNEGYSDEQILQFEVKDKLTDYLTKLKGEGYDLSQFSDAINNIAETWAKTPENLFV